MKKGYKELLEEAEGVAKTLPVEEARALHGRPDVQFVDVRDVRELERDGLVPDSFHAPRGMLEFWIDPESPYHKPVFGEDKLFVFYCSAGWRSALAARTGQEMGLKVAHIRGGFGAWRQDGGSVVERQKR